MVAVADDERERRPERPAVPQASEHLDLVRLDLLPRTAPVALLAAPEVGVDRAPVEDEAGREPGDDRDERGPVRLAGGRERERHGRKGRPVAPAKHGRKYAEVIAAHSVRRPEIA